MNLTSFFRSREVFTLRELDEALMSRGRFNLQTRNAILRYHRVAGHITPVRRGVYATMFDKSHRYESSIDPFIVASKISGDATIVYHSALELQGKGYSTFNTVFVESQQRVPSFQWQQTRYEVLATSKRLIVSNCTGFGVKTIDRHGTQISVTNLERTLIDLLDKPQYGGGWEEILRSLELIEFVNVGFIIEYVQLLQNATIAAKVGFYLEQQRDRWMIEEVHLAPFRAMRPKNPCYFSQVKPRTGRLVNAWNLIVPEEILNQSWQEEL